MYIPTIIETINSGRTSKVIDLFSKFFKNRCIYFSGELDNESADIINMQMLALDQNSNDDINLYVDSPGGSVSGGFAIRDCMEQLKSKVNTIGIGECSSMGCYLVASGTGLRRATKRTRFLIHSVRGGTIGTVREMELKIEESKRYLNQVKQDLIDFSNGKLTLEKLNELVKEDSFFGVNEAIEYGIIDQAI